MTVTSEPIRTVEVAGNGQRVVENLRQGLQATLDGDPDVHLLGEDVVDPYGGAFKATRGLSERYSDRVLSTPISESAIVGMAGGLALAGQKAIIEIMFADFVGLAFDQITNFAAKSTTMYGRALPMPMIVRCPSGGHRGYGPTHSQSPQKHFLGVPGLSVCELTPFHDAATVLPALLAEGRPSMLFEDKVLYTRRLFDVERGQDVFSFRRPGALGTAEAFVSGTDDCDVVVICTGGMAHRTLGAIRSALMSADLIGRMFTPLRLYPFDIEAMLPAIERAGRVVVVEESTAGGTWGAEVAHAVGRRAWNSLRAPVRLVHSMDSIIPAAVHLEEDVLVREHDILAALLEVAHA